MYTSIKMSSRYFESIMSGVVNKAVQLSANDSVSGFFNGNYQQNIVEQNRKSDVVSKEILDAALSENSVSKIVIFSKGLGLSS